MEKGIQKTFVNDTKFSFTDDFDFNRYFGDIYRFREFMLRYQCALKEIQTKFEILNDHLSIAYNRNPIEMIKSRVKMPKSIVEKLKRRGFELSYDSISKNLNDVAGIRIICSFVNDIYEVANMLVSQDDVKLLEVKDYIKNPKPNGYRSYHMIVEIPVFMANNKLSMKVEVQLRTIAMDFWASLEHKIQYKKDLPESEEIVKQLKECADLITTADLKMQDINNFITDV